MAKLLDPHACLHRNRIGDNYGSSCMDCGAQMTGYGYYDEYKTCFHLFTRSDDGTYQVCIFCELEIDRPNGEEELK